MAGAGAGTAASGLPETDAQKIYYVEGTTQTAPE